MRIITLPNSTFSKAKDVGPTALSGLLTPLLAGIFIVAGILKWNDPTAFQVSLLHFDLFPEWTIAPIVYGIPLIEIILGLLCLSVSFRELGYCLLLLLTIAYTALLIVECFRGISPGCGCFGSHSAEWPYWALFIRNLWLLVIEAYLIRTDIFLSVILHISRPQPEISP